jgi:hypothetical protein
VNLFWAVFRHLEPLWYPKRVKIARLAGGVPLFFSTLPRFWRVRIRKSLSRQKVSPLVVNAIYISNLEWKYEKKLNPFVTLEYF